MKIEELSDDFQESVQISEDVAQPQLPKPGPDLLTQAMMNAFSSNQPPHPDSSAGPQVPPGMAAMRNKSGAEILAELNKSPLFMTDLEENDDLEALKALAYEGSPGEVAANFKERGNESFREKGWRDAKEFYGKAIEVLLIEVRRRQKEGGSTKDEDQDQVKKEVGILEACLVNRGACHLELGNYRSCTSAKALLSLGKIVEADDACARGLAIDPENKALRAIAREIIKRNEELSKRKKIDLKREQQMEDAKIEMVPDPTDPISTISFPAILLYPLHLESDFIKAFNETEPLCHHLSYILPLPWDVEGEYTPNTVECYMETTTGGLLKVGKNAILLKILTASNVEVVDEIVKIFVVPKSKSASWIQEFKTKKAAEKMSG
ncbi:putative Hsp70/Hsp90 co-chaperone CNS1 [Amylocarpus encephaloides]|uniref:Hsp70/Hsp90 co-chaperone CNS1 n=1 Tax=Amylocarpus encephaloides TaxID=45428 RepID=A0A9P7YL04_9HELO|nr:putative Hsp70/Hsp90 co-chaperone CNS1 [Amylocarpus encephaloides]